MVKCRFSDLKAKFVPVWYYQGRLAPPRFHETCSADAVIMHAQVE